jgi:hypothetical protein
MGIVPESNQTWNALAQCCCQITGKEFQECSGAAFPNTLAKQLFLAELQPLPCAKGQEWPWGGWFPNVAGDAGWLGLRGKQRWLRGDTLVQRAKRLGKLVEKHNPAVVLCYGSSPLWKLLEKESGRNLLRIRKEDIEANWSARPEHVLLNVPHPKARTLNGCRNFYAKLGARLAQEVRAGDAR